MSKEIVVKENEGVEVKQGQQVISNIHDVDINNVNALSDVFKNNEATNLDMIPKQIGHEKGDEYNLFFTGVIVKRGVPNSFDPNGANPFVDLVEVQFIEPSLVAGEPSKIRVTSKSQLVNFFASVTRGKGGEILDATPLMPYKSAYVVKSQGQSINKSSRGFHYKDFSIRPVFAK